MVTSVTVSSKSLKSIHNFFLFLNKYKNLNFYSIENKFKKKNKKIILTILKSPHVNKKAQEQFEIRYFTIQLSISTTRQLEYLIFLKKIQRELFPDIKLKINLKINYKYINKMGIKFLNLDNYNTIKFYNYHNNLCPKIYSTTINKKNTINKKLNNFLKLLSIYGKSF